MAQSSSSKKPNAEGKPRRGRPPYHAQAKIRLNLSLTLRSHYYLGLVAFRQKTSMSEIIEEFATAMSQIQCGLRPLGHGSKRQGNKAMRGQSINYEERKTSLHLSVTPTTKRLLKQLAAKANDPQVKPSISDLVERHCRCIAEPYIDSYPYPPRKRG